MEDGALIRVATHSAPHSGRGSGGVHLAPQVLLQASRAPRLCVRGGEGELQLLHLQQHRRVHHLHARLLTRNLQHQVGSSGSSGSQQARHWR